MHVQAMAPQIHEFTRKLGLGCGALNSQIQEQ
jgi:hypothetical protein